VSTIARPRAALVLGYLGPDTNRESVACSLAALLSGFLNPVNRQVGRVQTPHR
jgi:hypothetical protein